jgi:predicted DNA-binding protein with PD1-like motif
MLAAETTRGRRLICAFDRGAELIAALRALLGEREVRSAEIRGAGFLDDVELARFDPLARSWRGAERLTGPLELLSLWGSVSEHSGDMSLKLQASVLPLHGGAMYGGHVASACVYAVELIVECFDDIILRRHPDAATGLPQWKEAISLGGPLHLPDQLTETIDQIDPARAARALPVTTTPEPGPKPQPDPGSGPRYQRYPTGSPMAVFEEPTPTGQVVLAPPDDDDPADNPTPNDPAPVIAGDLINHPRLGRCVVEAVEPGGEYARLRLRSGRMVRMSLSAVDLAHRPGTTAPRIFDALV